MSINDIKDIPSAEQYLFEKFGYTGDNKNERNLIRNAIATAKEVRREYPNSFIARDAIHWLFFNLDLTTEESEKIDSVI